MGGTKNIGRISGAETLDGKNRGWSPTNNGIVGEKKMGPGEPKRPRAEGLGMN